MLPEFDAIDPELEAADHERGAADPASAGSARRRTIFDLENISEHEKAAGAKKVFYRMGLNEFLAACGVREPSWAASPHGLAVHEGTPGGPRRIIFDVENISGHEKAAGAKSEGLTIGPCCDYNGSKPVWMSTSVC